MFPKSCSSRLQQPQYPDVSVNGWNAIPLQLLWPKPEKRIFCGTGKVWGYYNRVRNLAAAAREIVARYEGRVPAGTESFRALPGVGDYIAAARGLYGLRETKSSH